MISIITPAFNAEHSIEQAIASVQRQSREDWELIIVDDGSTDSTWSILEAVSDFRIRVVRQENAGVSAARNTGLRLARGEYITFLDADDTLPRDALKVRADLLDSEPQIDIVHGAVQLLWGDHEMRVVQPDLKCGPLLDRLVRLQEDVFVGVCYMLRREKIGQLLFQERLSHCEDLIFYLTLAHDSDLEYAAVPQIVYEYRLSPTSSMSNMDGLEAGYLELLRRVLGMERIGKSSRVYLRRRVKRIMFLSWLRRGNPKRALQSLHKAARFTGSWI